MHEMVDTSFRLMMCCLLMACLVFLVNAANVTDEDTYVVIDVSGGHDASNWPVSNLASAPKEGWSDEYKTTKIVLKKMLPGGFVRRKRISEYPGISTNCAEVFHVQVKKPFWIGVFPITQKQWELVSGKRPSSFSKEECYAKRPVDSVSWSMLRGRKKGALYPKSNEVDADSFLGILREKTGLSELDIPTEDEWEYACHGMVESQYGNGQDNPAAMLDLGRYEANSGGYGVSHNVDSKSGTAEVGSYQPNAWGLYDMQGGVWEWCLDLAYPSDDPQPCSAIQLGVDRVLKGGHWGSPSDLCAMSVRAARCSDMGKDCSGARLLLRRSVTH